MSPSPLSNSIEDLKHYSLNETFKTFKLDDLSRSGIERKSYEDLLDRCLEQERLLSFDENIKEEADKLAKELENVSDSDLSSVSQPFSLNSTDVNSSEAGPITADEDISKSDIFEDGSNFDFDYLSKIRGKPGNCPIRESLFLKFDPLAGSGTPEKNSDMAENESNSGTNTPPSSTPNGDEKLVSVSPIRKEEASPAGSSVNTPRGKTRPSSGTATPTLRHEILSKEISKLQDLMLKQEFSYQEQIAARSEEIDELRNKVAELESKQPEDNVSEKLSAMETEAERLRKQVAENNEQKKQLTMIMEEYEKTISQVVTMREDDRKKFETEKEQLASERDEAVQHLRNMEIAFNDVHQKYEKCKEVIEAFKHNETQYKLSLAENKKTIMQQEENYQKLKDHASQKLEAANNEIAEMTKAHQVEVAKLSAMNRKMEIHLKTLEESLEQKKREVIELTKICDELITKVGHG